MGNKLISSCPMLLAADRLATVFTSYAAMERIKIAAIGTKAKPLVGVSITRTAQRLDFTGCIGAGRMEPGWALSMRQQPQETDGLLEPENEPPLLSCCHYCAGLRHHFCALSGHALAGDGERAGFTCACGRTTRTRTGRRRRRQTRRGALSHLDPRPRRVHVPPAGGPQMACPAGHRGGDEYGEAQACG